MHDEDENVTLGRLTITRKCRGSGTCRNYAPSLLEEVPSANAKRDGHRLRAPMASYEAGAFTAVKRQPRRADDRIAARTAAASCPFAAIRLVVDNAPGRKVRLPSPWAGYPKALDFIEAEGGVLSSSWSSLPDHDVSLTATAMKRAVLLGCLGVAAVASLATVIALGVAR